MKVISRLLFVLAFSLTAWSQENSEALIVLPEAPSASVPASEVPGASYTPLRSRQKFAFFVRSTADPSNLVGAALEAGLSQRSHDNLGFGQGANGFGGRYGAALLDRATFNFFSQYLFATAFRRDPRYEPLRMGSTRSRIKHAVGSALISRKDDGSMGFNAPVVLGAVASGALSNAYYPAGERGAVFTARSSALNFGGVMGTRLLTEFLPDIKRKLLRRK